ncbi:C-type mannose receptor 2-like [Neodiprion fabricii]|uniref:C-type mannose receptor 2-like n=1 Tax=Neodiprion fabricii TaxID=2872261 RepID=UPI001ED8DF9E|nr:C-type mannose receptor 2-like [Neodiprion fabricii]XP_046433523.1 C-type mannose receptor 2-like [Neodiprion fabricii]
MEKGGSLRVCITGINKVRRSYTPQLIRLVLTKTDISVKMIGQFQSLFLQLACVLTVFGVLSSARTHLQVIVNHAPRSYTPYRDNTVSYKVFTEERTWKEAEQKCIEDGARLAIIDTYDKVRFVGDIKPFVCHLWVGIRRSGPSDAWTKAHNGAPVPNVPWAPTQPNGTQNCSTIQGCNLGLGDEDCAARLGFVCEKPISGQEETFSLSASMSLKQVCQLIASPSIPKKKAIASLPDGYAPILDSSVAYKVYKKEVTWVEAKELCEREGASLAVADNQKIYEYLMTKSSLKIHVGIYSKFDEWINIRDGSTVSNIPWKSGEPGKSQGCVRIEHVKGVLETIDCRVSSTHYACELPIPEKDPATNSVKPT